MTVAPGSSCPDARDVVDAHLMVNVAGALPGEHVADVPLLLPGANERLDHLGVLARVELVRLGRRQVGPPGLERHLIGQVLIGDEQQVRDPQPVGDARGVRAGAAGVRQRFDVGVGVDVGHRGEAAAGGAQELLALGDVVGVDLRQRAERVEAGEIDRTLGRQRVAPLGHEADAAEDHQRALRRSEIARLDRQLEAVTDEVGDRLDLGHLVVVGRDEGALFALEPADLVPQPGDTAA